MCSWLHDVAVSLKPAWPFASAAHGSTVQSAAVQLSRAARVPSSLDAVGSSAMDIRLPLRTLDQPEVSARHLFPIVEDSSLACIPALGRLTAADLKSRHDAVSVRMDGMVAVGGRQHSAEAECVAQRTVPQTPQASVAAASHVEAQRAHVLDHAAGCVEHQDAKDVRGGLGQGLMQPAAAVRDTAGRETGARVQTPRGAIVSGRSVCSGRKRLPEDGGGGLAQGVLQLQLDSAKGAAKNNAQQGGSALAGAKQGSQRPGEHGQAGGSDTDSGSGTKASRSDDRLVWLGPSRHQQQGGGALSREQLKHFTQAEPVRALCAISHSALRDRVHRSPWLRGVTGCLPSWVGAPQAAVQKNQHVDMWTEIGQWLLGVINESVLSDGNKDSSSTARSSGAAGQHLGRRQWRAGSSRASLQPAQPTNSNGCLADATGPSTAAPGKPAAAGKSGPLDGTDAVPCIRAGNAPAAHPEAVLPDAIATTAPTPALAHMCVEPGATERPAEPGSPLTVEVWNDACGGPNESISTVAAHSLGAGGTTGPSGHVRDAVKAAPCAVRPTPRPQGVLHLPLPRTHEDTQRAPRLAGLLAPASGRAAAVTCASRSDPHGTQSNVHFPWQAVSTRGTERRAVLTPGRRQGVALPGRQPGGRLQVPLGLFEDPAAVTNSRGQHALPLSKSELCLDAQPLARQGSGSAENVSALQYAVTAALMRMVKNAQPAHHAG